MEKESSEFDKNLYSDLAEVYNGEKADVSFSNPSYRSIIARFNVKNMSIRELQKMANELYDAGIISAKECIDMGEPMMSPYFYESYFGISLNLDEKHDFIKDWEGKLTWEQENNGTREQIQSKKNILAILKGIHQVRSSVYSVILFWQRLSDKVKMLVKALVGTTKLKKKTVKANR